MLSRPTIFLLIFYLLDLPITEKSSIDFFIYNSGYISYSFQSFCFSLMNFHSYLYVALLLGAHILRIISYWKDWPLYHYAISLFICDNFSFFWNPQICIFKNLMMRMIWNDQINLWYSMPWIWPLFLVSYCPRPHPPPFPCWTQNYLSEFPLKNFVSLFLCSNHSQLPVMLHFL